MTETLIPLLGKYGKQYKFGNVGPMHSTTTMDCSLLITYIIHCYQELNPMGMMLPLQELTSRPQAERSKAKVCEHILLDLSSIFFLRFGSNNPTNAYFQGSPYIYFVYHSVPKFDSFNVLLVCGSSNQEINDYINADIRLH